MDATQSTQLLTDTALIIALIDSIRVTLWMLAGILGFQIFSNIYRPWR